MQPRDPETLCRGRFEVLRPLGCGAYGDVFEVLDHERGCRVALKRLMQLNPEALLRFKREFRAAAEVEHPNLVHLGDLFEDEGKWLFTMELVEGADLVDHVRAADGCDVTRLRACMEQLAEALMALHAGGRVHRDVKPGNVRVTPEGRVVLLDFGLVTEHDPHGRDRKLTGVVGTPAYMAPEQACHADVSDAADWYSVGVLLFEALTGERPFDGGALMMMVHKQSGSSVRPRDRSSAVPDDLDSLCVALLHPEPRARPGGRQVLEVMRRPARPVLDPGPTSHVQPPSGQLSLGAERRFVGRAAELQALGRCFERTRSGHLGVAHISGESGVGKSALVDALLRAVRPQHPGLLVLRGACFLRETLSYKAFDGVIDALAQKLNALPPVTAGAVVPRHVDSLLRMFPVLGNADALHAHPRRTRAVPPASLRDEGRAALRELLERLANQLPLVVVIDDLQWADPDSLELLRVLLEPPDPPALTLLLASRPLDECEPEVALAIERALLAGEATRVRLGGLTPEDATALATDLLGPEHADRADQLVRDTAGHPLFLSELARHAREAPPGSASTPTLDEALRGRISQLESVAQEALQTLAVSAGPLRPDTLCAALRIDWSVGDRALKSLSLLHLARPQSRAGLTLVDTYHARVRAAALSRLETGELTRIHRSLAEALQRHEPEASQHIALHLAAAGEPQAASEHAIAAARSAAHGLAFERTAYWYEQALHWRHDFSQAERRSLLAQMGEAYSGAGRGLDAAQAFTAAAEGAERTQEIELTRRAAEHFLRSGAIDRGIDASRYVIEALGLKWHEGRPALLGSLGWGRLRLGLRKPRYQLRHPSELDPEQLVRADALYWIADALGAVDTLRSMSLQTAGLFAALESGEPGRIARALGIAAAWRGMARSGIDARARDLFESAEEVAQKTDDPRVAPALRFTRALVDVFAMQPAAALRNGDSAERAFREDCVDVENQIVLCQVNGLVALSMLGGLREISERVAKYDARARSRGNLFSEAMVFTTGGFLCHIRSDDTQAGIERAEDLMARWPGRGFQLQHLYALWAQGNLLCYQGGIRGRTLFDQRWPQVSRSGLLTIPFWRIVFTSLYARSALVAARDDPRRRVQHLALADRLTRDVGRAHKFAGGAAQALLTRAGIAHMRGDEDTARDALQTAGAFLEERHMGMTLNPLRYQLGKLLGGDAGAELRAQSETWARAQGVADLSRLAHLYIPGFG